MKKTFAAAAVILSATAAANATTIMPPPSGRYLWEGELFDTSTTCSGNTVGGAPECFSRRKVSQETATTRPARPVS